LPVRSIEASRIYPQLWRSADTIGTVLLTMVLDSYGQEIFEQDPQAFRKDIEEGFSVDDIPAVNTDKVWALWSSLTTDLVHKDVSTFMNTANVLSGTPLSYDVFDIADVYECAWALTELTMLDPETSTRLSPEVRRYIGEVCKEQGLYRLPQALAKVADMGREDFAANMESHAADTVEAQMIVQNQVQFRDDVQAYVQRQTNRLMVQLNGAPLINRDTKSWNSFVDTFSKGLSA
jgi:hypothetical protein